MCNRNFSATRTFAGLLATTGILMAAACQTVADSEAEARTTPFELVRNEIIIDAGIGGSSPHRFMLDSGVDPSAIDVRLARDLGIGVDESSAGEAAGTGDGEGLEVMESSIPGLSIGGYSYGDIVALAADLSPFSEALGLPLAGILGHSFLENRVVRIDYPARQITIARNQAALGEPSTPVSQRYALPLVLYSKDDPTPVFDLMINGETISVTLDTGSSGGLELFPATITRLHLEGLKDAGEATEALGARGQRMLTRGTLETVGLGPFSLSQLDTRFAERTAEGETRDGNAGNKLFQNFVLTLDYVTGEVVFEQ